MITDDIYKNKGVILWYMLFSIQMSAMHMWLKYSNSFTKTNVNQAVN
jgi:hypothetical protein